MTRRQTDRQKDRFSFYIDRFIKRLPAEVNLAQSVRSQLPTRKVTGSNPGRGRCDCAGVREAPWDVGLKYIVQSSKQFLRYVRRPGDGGVKLRIRETEITRNCSGNSI